MRSYHITIDTQKKKSHSVVAHSFFDGFTSEAEEKVMIRPAKMRHWPFSKLTIATTANCSTPTPRLIGTTTPTWPTRTPPLSWVSGRGSFLTLESWLDFFCYWKKKKISFSCPEVNLYDFWRIDKLRTDCDILWLWVEFQHSNKFQLNF